MGEDTQKLDEVVVTALGIKRSEKALSYNVQKVNNDALTSVKDANFVNSLNGKVAGVNIQRSASGVGGSTRVTMRGNKSISGDNNVLYVVDGVPIGNQADRTGDGTGFGSGRTSGEGIANFNPDDIESVSVLTGPSAAALYGASAANGVILINTKKGEAGKMRIDVSSSVEFMTPLTMPKFQNRYGISGNYYSWGDKLENQSSYDPKDFFELGATFNNSFNLSTGNDKNQTYFSIAAVNSDGIVPNNKYHRYNVTLRNTAKFLNDKLTLDASASYIREYYNNMISYGTYFNPIVGAYLYPRGEDFEKEKYFERYNSELGYSQQQWSPGDFGMDIQNPYWIAYRNIRPEVKDRYMLYASLKYDITNYLNVAGRVRLDNTYTEKEDKRYASTINTYASTNGRYTYSNETFRQKYADIMVNFDKQFAEIYHATINAGTSFEEYDTKGRGYGGQLLLVPNKFVYSNIDPTQSTASQTGGDSRRRNFAVFASAELSWNSALYLTLTGRADKPSQLVNSDDPWIFYPSVGLSAIVTELLPNNIKEKLEPTLGFLKVRASYTEVGSPIPYTGLTPGTLTHELEGGTFKPFKYYPISNLKAERTRSYEVGLDSKWFNNTNYLNVAGRVRLDNTYTEKEDKRYASTINTYASTNGRYTYSNETFRQKYADIMVNFDKQFAEIYHATINAGTSFEEYDTKGRGYGGQLLLVPNKFVYSNIDPTQSTASQTGGDSRRRNFAVFASAELSWNSALYLTLTGRADKPSQLVNSDDPWIFYPSVGLSAIVTELLPNNIKEKLEPTLGFLKVRASYTEVGSPIPYTGLTPGTLTHELEGGTFKPFKYYPISNLKAERTRSYEVGLDSKWFNNTITFGVTYYHSNTYNQLLKATLGSNFEYMFVQAGNVQNRGLELSLGFDKKFGDFNYNTTFTATTNKNKIIQLARDVLNPVTNTLIDLTDIQVGRFRLREGGEIGTVYANEWLKRDGDNYIDYQPGQALTTETTSPYKLGSVNPKWNLGWQHGFSYKGFNLNLLFTARIGGIVISKTQAMLDRYGVSEASADARDAGGVSLGYFKVDPKTYYDAVSNLDAYYTYSATNVRLQEARLTYTFPNKWFKGTVNNLSLSVYGTNLWMIYNKAPYDPELTASTGTFGQGYDYFMLPSQSTYGLSLKFGF